MCRSGNAPRTAFATADPDLQPSIAAASRIGSAVVLFGVNAFELAEARRDKRAGTAMPRGQVLGEKSWANSLRAKSLGGKILMKSIQTDTSDPIPLRTSPHGIGTITIRFVGLLVVAVVILALAWS